MAGEAEASPATKIWDPGGISDQIAAVESDRTRVAAAIESSGAVRVGMRAGARRTPPKISASASLKVFQVREKLGNSPARSNPAAGCVELDAGDVVGAWKEPVESCPDEEETPDPLSISDDVTTLVFMETSIEDSRKEYLGQISSHVSEEMLKAVPKLSICCLLSKLKRFLLLLSGTGSRLFLRVR